MMLNAIAEDGLSESFDDVVSGLGPALRSMLRIANAQTLVVPPSSNAT